MKRNVYLLLLFFFTAGLNAQTIKDIVVNSPDHNTLEIAIIAAELDDDLDGAGPFTLFAPTDDAFAALGGTVDDLLQNPTGDLQDILLYHVLGSEVNAAAVSNGLIADALSSTNTLKFTRTSTGEVYVNQALVTITDIPATNGVVHVIDAVVLPSETVVDVAIDNGFGTLTTAVVAAELLPALTDPFGTYTVFAPTDDAFAALGQTVDDLLQDPTGDLQDILLYHVLGSEVDAATVSNGLIADALSTTNTLKFTKTSGGAVFVNQAQVTTADVGASNGIVHIIDAVVLPSETVVDVAIDNGFGTLTTAVVAAELLPALTDPFGTYTVFAPTDDAFAALGGTVDDLLQDPTGDLQDILLYHVLGSEVDAATVSNGLIADALSSTNTLKFTKTSGGAVFVNQAQVTTADVGASNGIVHIIDAVVLPSETVVDVAIDNGFGTLTTAVVAAELLPALTDPFGTYTVFAPTDEAFAELGGTVDDLLQDPTGDLQDILLYHVLGSEVFSTDLSNGQVAETLEGSNITVTIENNLVFINEAQVTLADVESDNGVVHVIDEVLLPEPVNTNNIAAQDAGIATFPNPTSNELNITMEAGFSNESGEKIVRFFNGLGQEVYSAQLNGNRNIINLNDLSSGIYYMRIETENGKNYFQKITLQR